jgi:hypothetical protein
MSGEQLFYLEIDSRHLDAVVRVNDIPVWRGTGAEQQGGGVCLNGVLNGQDRLDVVGAWTRIDDNPDGRLALTVAGYAPGDIVGVDGEPFFRDEFRDLEPNVQINQRRGLATRISARWAWMDAPVVDPTSPGARDFIEQIARAWRAGDAASIFAAMAPAMADRPGAFPLDTVEDYVARLTPTFAQPAVTTGGSPDPSEPVLRRVADGRLLEAVDATGAPYIRKTVRGGEVWSFPILIGRHGPDWAIYR